MEDALSVLNYRPGVDRRGRPKTTEVFMGFYTTRVEKAGLVRLARAEKVTVSELIRRILHAALVGHTAGRRR